MSWGQCTKYWSSICQKQFHIQGRNYSKQFKASFFLWSKDSHIAPFCISFRSSCTWSKYFPSSSTFFRKYQFKTISVNIGAWRLPGQKHVRLDWIYMDGSYPVFSTFNDLYHQYHLNIEVSLKGNFLSNFTNTRMTKNVITWTWMWSQINDVSNVIFNVCGM